MECFFKHVVVVVLVEKKIEDSLMINENMTHWS